MFKVGDKVKHINPRSRWKPEDPNAIGTVIKAGGGMFFVTWSDGTWGDCDTPMSYTQFDLKLIDSVTLTTTESYV